ncbi:MAG TPA: DUF4340 domain-containing protein [Candidatus Limnocylindria bacterium]|nr:DUF4340 domain-containing protein [Candidatus Limnocylindria bacterium]
MTLRGTLVLYAVLAVLAAYLLIVPPPAPPPGPESLLGVPVESADTIEIAWPDAAVRFRRSDGSWRSDAGAVAPAAIDELLEALAMLRPTENLGAPQEPADYGLDARATRVVVSAAGEPVASLEVGDRNPAWTGVYVRRTGSNDVVVVGALLHWELEKLRAVATP